MREDNAQIIAIGNELRRKWQSVSRPMCSMRINRVTEEMSMPRCLFEPSLVALGPFHHQNPKFQAMEALKERYAKRFFERCETNIEKITAGIIEIEEKLRCQYYGGTLTEFSSNELTIMMLIDGAFLIEFFIRFYRQEWDEIDRMSRKRWTLLKLDIMLLENQLPMLLLEQLFNVACPRISFDGNVSLRNLIVRFLVRSELLPFKVSTSDPGEHSSVHVLGFVPMFMASPGRFLRAKTSLTMPSSPTISQLRRAGVKFRQSHRQRVEIVFANGILEIPTLTIDENTEKLLANALAYEISNGEVHGASDYVAMMDSFVDGPQDIKILVKHGIVKNHLKDNEAASDMINCLGKNIAIHDHFNYSYLVEDLNRHCRSSSAKLRTEFFEWGSDLKQNYVENRWKLLSVIAAVALLVLTVIQTVCSILQLK